VSTKSNNNKKYSKSLTIDIPSDGENSEIIFPITKEDEKDNKDLVNGNKNKNRV